MRAIFGLSALIVLLDQATKFLAVQFLKPLGQISVIPGVFHLSYVENTGIAFGMFQDHPSIWSGIISVSVLALFVGSYFFRDESVSKRVAYSFILGGALGNWIDRIRLHSVIDFLNFIVWPVFNIADSFITIGVVIFIWYAIRGK